MLEALDQVEWDAIPQPEWNRPLAVPAAIRALAAASSDSAAWDAYNRFLFATGNNHAGTYYPVVLESISFLGELLRGGAPFARMRTLDALIDLTGSFSPEPGYENSTLADGSAAPLESRLKGAVCRMWDEVASEVTARATDSREIDLVEQLATLVAEQRA